MDQLKCPVFFFVLNLLFCFSQAKSHEGCHLATQEEILCFYQESLQKLNLPCTEKPEIDPLEGVGGKTNTKGWKDPSLWVIDQTFVIKISSQRGQDEVNGSDSLRTSLEGLRPSTRQISSEQPWEPSIDSLLLNLASKTFQNAAGLPVFFQLMKLGPPSLLNFLVQLRQSQNQEPPELRKCLYNIGRCLRWLHQHHCVHNNLAIRNILVEITHPEVPVYLIDFEKSGPSQLGNNPFYHDLSKFLRNFFKNGCVFQDAMQGIVHPGQYIEKIQRQAVFYLKLLKAFLEGYVEIGDSLPLCSYERIVSDIQNFFTKPVRFIISVSLLTEPIVAQQAVLAIAQQMKEVFSKARTAFHVDPHQMDLFMKSFVEKEGETPDWSNLFSSES